MEKSLIFQFILAIIWIFCFGLTMKEIKENQQILEETKNQREAAILALEKSVALTKGCE